jgi:hypothetical protein
LNTSKKFGVSIIGNAKLPKDERRTILAGTNLGIDVYDCSESQLIYSITASINNLPESVLMRIRSPIMINMIGTLSNARVTSY